MTTLGYGDISTLSYSGKWLMVCATFLGVIFEGMLLVAWSKATTFTKAEAAAYKMLKLDHLKFQMKEAASSKFKIIWKLRRLFARNQLHNDYAEIIHLEDRFHYWVNRTKTLKVNYDSLLINEESRKLQLNAKIGETAEMMENLFKFTDNFKNQMNAAMVQLEQWKLMASEGSNYVNQLDEEINWLKSEVRKRILLKKEHCMRARELRLAHIKSGKGFRSRIDYSKMKRLIPGQPERKFSNVKAKRSDTGAPV